MHAIPPSCVPDSVGRAYDRSKEKYGQFFDRKGSLQVAPAGRASCLLQRRKHRPNRVADCGLAHCDCNGQHQLLKCGHPVRAAPSEWHSDGVVALSSVIIRLSYGRNCEHKNLASHASVLADRFAGGYCRGHERVRVPILVQAMLRSAFLRDCTPISVMSSASSHSKILCQLGNGT